jgi:hypothetical protein
MGRSMVFLLLALITITAGRQVAPMASLQSSRTTRNLLAFFAAAAGVDSVYSC